MALPGSGLIAITNIVSEFGGTAPHALNEYYRGGAYIPNHANTAGIPTAGTIGFAHFYAASKTFAFAETITVSMVGYNLRSRLLTAGWDGVTKVDALVNIGAGVFISSNPVNTWAWRVGGSLPAGSIVRLYNYGFIIGSGGRGANGAGIDTDNNVIASTIYNPTSALLADWFVTVYNYGYIASGGGGGGGGASRFSYYQPAYDDGKVAYPETLGNRSGGGGGGNGAGAPYYGAAPGGYAAFSAGYVSAQGQPGTVGDNTLNGVGGAGGSTGGVVGGVGGQGGGLGASGSTGGVGSGGIQRANTYGGGPQYAYYYGANISWAVYGNVIGLTA